MSLSMKDKSNRKKRYILAGIFLGIAALLGIERCVNDEPEAEQRIEQKKADKAPSQSTTPHVSSSLDKTKVQKDSGRSDCVYNKLGNVSRNVTSINTRRIKKSSMTRKTANGKHFSSEQPILSPSLSTDVSSLNDKTASIKHETKEPGNESTNQKTGEHVLDNSMNSQPSIVQENPKESLSLITYSFPSHHLFRIGIRAEVGYSIITGLSSIVDNVHYLSPFMDAWEGGAQDQLEGQIASAKIPLSRMISPAFYWVMTGDDFSLDINNPNEPKVLVVGNNPDRQNIYSAALGLYNSRIVKLINKKKQLKSSVIIDELPTIYFRGLDKLSKHSLNALARCFSNGSL